MKLFRPYIPLAVRVQVAERQVVALGAPIVMHAKQRLYLRALLFLLFGDSECELHHRPALCNRRRIRHGGKVFYDPPANDPGYLIYLEKGAHDIETRVRGVGAQRSDLGQRRYFKKLADNREKRRKEAKGILRKIRWRSRPLPSESRWPKGRKIANRRKPNV